MRRQLRNVILGFVLLWTALAHASGFNGGGAGGGGGTPGGSAGQVQWNSAGAFAGIAPSGVNGSNVGLGTANPLDALDVASASGGGYSLHTYGAGNQGLYATYGARGTEAGRLPLQANDRMAGLGAFGYGTSQYETNATGLAAFYSAETRSNTAGGTYFALATTPLGSVTRAERVRIDPAGNVGVGTSTFGTSATNTLALALGTPPSTSPAGVAQLTVVNVSGANTAGWQFRDEVGNVDKIGRASTGGHGFINSTIELSSNTGAGGEGLKSLANASLDFEVGTNRIRFNALGIYLNTGVIGWGTSLASYDIGLGRTAAGVAEINNGTAGQYRDMRFRKLQWGTDTQPTCDATTRGLVIMVQGAA